LISLKLTIQYYHKNKKDILCNYGVRHCLEPNLLETKFLLGAVKYILTISIAGQRA